MKYSCINKHIHKKSSKKDEYDAIIVGAGIGGLVCGCYLAKAGKKVLIVEKNHQVGGYCCSFKRDGVLFDACVYSVGSCRENGIIDNILNDLDLKNQILFTKIIPRRVIVSDDKTIEFGDSNIETIQNLCKHFPMEQANIQRLFRIILSDDYLKMFARIRDITFMNFLKILNIKNQELINLFSFLFLESSGLPSSKISAFIGVILLKDYILDGGYYPQGGMQNFSNQLAFKFENFGGKILLNSEIEKIIMVNNKVVGVQTKMSQVIKSSIVISNADLRQTLSKLVGDEMDGKLLNLKPSLSTIILYLKLEKKIDLPTYIRFISLKENIEEMYSSILRGNFDKIYLDCFVNKFRDSTQTVNISMVAPFKTKKFWDKNKPKLVKKLLSTFAVRLNLDSSQINLIEVAIPYTLHKWTYSYAGASFGWAAIPNQVFPKWIFSPSTYGLYYVGHWLGKGHGISTVAYLGKQIARRILLRKSTPQKGVDAV